MLNDLSSTKCKIEELEKQNTIVRIKLETAVSENSSLSDENATLNNRLDEIQKNIGNAENRSEKAVSEVKEKEERLAVAVRLKTEASKALKIAEEELKSTQKKLCQVESLSESQSTELKCISSELKELRGELEAVNQKSTDFAKEKSSLLEQLRELREEKESIKANLLEKAEEERTKLISISTELEEKCARIEQNVVAAEELAGERLGQIANLERETRKQQDIAEELRERLRFNEAELHKSLECVSAQKSDSEKAAKMSQKQVQELKKELQKVMDKEKELAEKENALEEEKARAIEEAANNGPEVDVDYLKHIVLRYITAPLHDREHILKALSQALAFSADDKKLVSDVLEYKKSWFGSKPPTPRGSIAPSIQSSRK